MPFSFQLSYLSVLFLTLIVKHVQQTQFGDDVIIMQILLLHHLQLNSVTHYNISNLIFVVRLLILLAVQKRILSFFNIYKTFPFRCNNHTIEEVFFVRLLWV